MSSAICLVAMMLFAITGITLNHAGDIEASANVTTQEIALPSSLVAILASGEQTDGLPPPPAIASWLEQNLSINLNGQASEWTQDELYIPLPRAGGDGWVSIDRQTGAVVFEDTDRGWIAYFNDLHKGRDTGTAWFWFIDLFAAACVIFCLTGFLLLQMHARKRPSTWPIVGAGVGIPLVLLIVLTH